MISTAKTRDEQANEVNALRMKDSAIESSVNAIALAELAGTLTYVNTSFLRLWGYEREDEVLGRHAVDFWKSREEAKDVVEALREQGSWTGELIARRKDGSFFDVQVAAGLVRDQAGEAILMMGSFVDITKRKRAERQRHEQQDLLRSIIEGTDDLIFAKDLQGRYILINPADAKGFGKSAEEIVGSTDLALFPVELAERIIETDRQVVATGRGLTYEQDFETHGGSVRTYLIRKYPRFDQDGRVIGVLGIARDITERKQAEAALIEHQDLLRSIIEGTDDRIFAKDLQGRYVLMNSSEVDGFGKPAEELLGLTDNELLDSDRAKKAMAIDREVVASGENIIYEQVLEVAGGDLRTYSVRKYPRFDQDGRVIGVLGIARDITERKRADEERRNLEAQIQHAQKLESLGVLAGGIAHDFNNILMGVLGNAHLGLQVLPPDSPVCEFLHEIDTAATRAADLTKQMLAYSGRGKFVTEPVDLSELVEEMAHLLGVTISKKTKLMHDFSPGLPAVDADATQLRQVIMNLVINASEAMGDKQGTITVSTGVVEVDDAKSAELRLQEGLPLGTYVYLNVTDDGCGMDDLTKAKLFDPFFTTKFTGRGLGLAAVQGIIRGHRGAINVDSKPDCGTTFQVLFPASERQVKPAAEPEPSSHLPIRTGTVLVVDDEDLALSVAQKGLERAGFSVLAVRDGREALEVFHAKKEQIDVVLLDLTMPYLSGAEVFQEMRRIQADVRVVVTSGYNEQEATSRISGTGFAGFIQKPYTPQALVAKVSGAIRSE